jgi:hypothetical protein
MDTTADPAAPSHASGDGDSTDVAGTPAVTEAQTPSGSAGAPESGETVVVTVGSAPATPPAEAAPPAPVETPPPATPAEPVSEVPPPGGETEVAPSE